MLRNSRVTAFTVFELLKENQLEVMGGRGGGGGEVILPIPRHTHRLGLILIILEVYAKRCPKCARISKQKLL